MHDAMNMPDMALWVLAVGPLGTRNDGSFQYEWVLLYQQPARSMVILAKDMASFQENYRSAALAAASSFGFTDCLMKPLQTYHNADCAYPPQAV